MEDRRTFLMMSAAAATSRTVLGANDRVQMGIIGLGMRGNPTARCAGRHASLNTAGAVVC